ncbi:MAG: hypothetical protein LBI10_12015 [Deltaproteobacteria bacterium]|nr:hypothetical protein [Deltaproteobacteria bacterium]
MKAADQGDADAQFFPGESYYYGHGAPKNKAEALIWLQRAAARGHDEAQKLIQKATNS